MKWNKRNLVCGADTNICDPRAAVILDFYCGASFKKKKKKVYGTITIEIAPKANSQDRQHRVSLDAHKGCVQAKAFSLSKTKRPNDLSSVLQLYS